jgi:hypothetical protein
MKSIWEFIRFIRQCPCERCQKEADKIEAEANKLKEQMPQKGLSDGQDGSDR